MKTSNNSNTMLKSLTLVAAVIVSLVTNLFAANDAANESATIDRPTAKFYGLIVNTNANVILIQGDKASVKIEGKKKDVDNIQVSVHNGSLIIDGTNNIPVTIYVTVEELNRVEVNGLARVYSSQVINSDVLFLKVNGNGSIKLDVRSMSLGMIVIGKGKIVVSGSTGDAYARVLGEGRVMTGNLDAYSSRVETSSARTATVKETDKSGRRLTLRMTN
jgi:hypothetical protein